MKIIKEGRIPNSENIRKFKCENCGCEFEANPDEYFENNNVIASIYCTYQIYSYSNCPHCHKMCSVGRPSSYAFTTTTTNLNVKDEEPIDFKDIIDCDSSTSTTYTFTLKSTDDEDTEEED